MGKLRTRVGLGAAVVGVGLALSAPAFADGGRFQITSPQSGATISSTPTVKGLGQPGARVAVEAISQRNNDNHHWNNGNGQPGNNGNQPGNNGNQPGNNGNQPGNNGPGNGNQPGNNGPGNNGPGTNGPGNSGPGNNGNQWNNGGKEPESGGNAVAGRCNATVNNNGWWACEISPRLRPGTYRVVARQTAPGGGNEVSSVDNLMVPGGQLPVTPGPDPVPVVAGGLVLLAGGAVVVAATRTRRRGKHAA